MATCNDIMKELESLGSEQTRKTYTRHGATPPMFGVKYGDLYKVVKKIGTDHALAMQLWATGNHDARTVATMIADPARMKEAELDEWARTASNPLSVDAVAKLAMNTAHARRCFDQWTKSNDEWTAAAGWHVFAGGCCGRPGDPPSEIAEQPDAFFEKWLDHIEKNIHTSPNRVRYAMNMALIGIGCRGGRLMEKALAAAKRIGTVEVDHGDTACQTPDAAAYIRKVVAHQANRKKSAKSKPKAKKTKSKKVTKTPASRKKTKKKWKAPARTARAR